MLIIIWPGKVATNLLFEKQTKQTNKQKKTQYLSSEA